MIIFDSGISLIYVPVTQINDLLFRLLKGKNYNTYSTGVIQVDCNQTSTFEDVFLMIGSKWIQIAAQDYILNT